MSLLFAMPNFLNSKLLFVCKDACNCDRSRANIERVFRKPSGYSRRRRGMASFYFLQNLTQKYTLADCCTVRFSKRKRC